MRSISELAIAALPDTWAVRLAGRGDRPGALVWQPQPAHAGDAIAGRRLASGLLLFDGRLVQTEASDPWQIDAPDHAWSDALHGHGWLDDAAATDDPEVWAKLSGWVWAWIDRHHDGSGPGWRPELVARRMVRWISYTIPLLRGASSDRSDALFRTLGQHLKFLTSRRGQTVSDRDRIEALAGLVYGMVSLEGAGGSASRAIRDLAEAADQIIGEDGGVASRNPEDLADIATQLIWIEEAIRATGLEPGPGHIDAIRRAVPTLRTLLGRNAELPRFHGGRSARATGLPDVLSRAPAALPAPPNPAMGFLRMSAGGSVVIVDAASAPAASAQASAHSSALGLEFTHEDQPILVSAGSGQGFGAKSTRSARRRSAHSSIEIANACPSIITATSDPRPEELLEIPGTVRGQVHGDAGSAWALCESTEYEDEFGLLVERRLHLDGDGPTLAGEDTALATRAETRARFTGRFPDNVQACPMAIRFHLHPSIKASHSIASQLIGLILPDGSRWSFRTDAREVTLAPSTYYDRARPRPRAALQIVATSYLIDFWGRITWSFQQIEGA